MTHYSASPPAVDEDQGVSVLAGGTVRWQEPSSAQRQEAMTSPPQSLRVGGDTLRFGAGEGASASGISRHVVSFEGTAGGSVLATKQRHGARDTVELIPGRPESRTDIQTALREGVLRQVAPGIYEDVQGSAARVEGSLEAPAPEAHTEPGAEVFDPEDSTLFDKVIEPLPQHAFDAATASVMVATLNGSDLSSAAKSLAGSAGLDPARALEYVEAGVAFHERAAARAVAEVGVTEAQKADFYAWTRSQQKDLHQALEGLVHRRDPAGFQALARQYRRANPPDLSAYHRAGFETHVSTDGEVMLRRSGGEWVHLKDLSK